MKRILIIKHGALGDVIRTSYVLRPLKKRFPDAHVTWVTKSAAAPLIQNHPDVDRIFLHDQRIEDPRHFAALAAAPFDWVISLDDELDSNYFLNYLEIKKLSGTYIEGGCATYTDDVAEWFDMGLISKLGKAKADELKLQNQSGHAEIFARMLGLTPFKPELFISAPGSLPLVAMAGARVGLNLSAGKRWPAKTLRLNEAVTLVRQLGRAYPRASLALLGGSDDLEYNEKLRAEASNSDLNVIEPGSLATFAARIKALDLLITSDSMALHMAIAQGVPSLSFFSATSAVEIDTFGVGQKIRSHAPDYCSYKPDADNSTITAARLMHAIESWRVLESEAVASQKQTSELPL